MTTPFPSHQMPSTWPKRHHSVRKNNTYIDCHTEYTYVFSQVQQLASLKKKADIKSHFPSEKKHCQYLCCLKIPSMDTSGQDELMTQHIRLCKTKLGNVTLVMDELKSSPAFRKEKISCDSCAA